MHHRRYLQTVLSGFIAFTIPGSALAGKGRPTLDEVCKLVPCRPPTQVRVRVDKEQYAEVDLPKAPYVYDGLVNVVAGETVYIEAEEATDGLGKLTYVKNPGNKKNVISIEFKQDASDKEHPMMVMTVNNPFKRPLKYEAGIHISGKDGFRKTSTCPVSPGLSTYESWPNPIFQIALARFRFLSPDDPQSCD